VFFSFFFKNNFWFFDYFLYNFKNFYNFMKGIFVIEGTLALFNSLGETLTQLVIW
jgi:hypothetical protein